MNNPYLLTMSTEEFERLEPLQIIRKIEERLEVLQQMVGSLYPPMVREECHTLRARYRELTGVECPK